MNSETLSNAGSTAVETARQYGQQAAGMAAGAGQHVAQYGRTLRNTTTSIPTEAYLIGALGSIGISLSLKLLGRDRDAEFVGQWAPTFLTLGLLSKLIRHDEHTDHTR